MICRIKTHDYVMQGAFLWLKKTPGRAVQLNRVFPLCKRGSEGDNSSAVDTCSLHCSRRLAPGEVVAQGDRSGGGLAEDAAARFFQILRAEVGGGLRI